MHYSDNWYKCPKCGQKLLKFKDDAISKGVFLKCKKCKSNIEIKIEPLEPKKL